MASPLRIAVTRLRNTSCFCAASPLHQAPIATRFRTTRPTLCRRKPSNWRARAHMSVHAPEPSSSSAPTNAQEAPVPPPARGDVLAVLGLGNIGPAFEGTRHNAGWDVVGALAARHSASFRTQRPMQAGIAEITIGTRKVILARPRTLMNLSGRTVRALMRQHGMPPSAVLVVADDMALEVGRARLRARGSAGGHNGLKSVEQSVGGREYPRLRVGIGEPRGGAAHWSDFVLKPFSRAERGAMEDIYMDCCDVIEEWALHEDFHKPVDLLGRLLSNRKA